MPINFPNNPQNNDTYVDGTTTWRYSTANNSWLVTTFGNPGLQNQTDLDNTLVGLNRENNLNVQVPAIGLEFDPGVRTLRVRSLGTQLQNLITLVDSTNNQLNAFNQRGILLKAGMIYHGSAQPTGLNAADAGQLWFNTTDNGLYAWSNGSWIPAGSGVTLTTNQIISGAKTFSNNVLLSSTARILGEGASKSIILAPTNASSGAVNALTVAFDGATFDVPVTLSAVTATTKTVLATLTDSQIISGLKTFTAGIKLGDANSTSRIYSSSSTSGFAQSDNISIQPNLAAAGRYIKLFNNSDPTETNGITIRPKNSDNQGALNVDGNQRINGNLTVVGNITSTNAIAAVTTVYGSMNQSNVNVAPLPIGLLTFTVDTSAPSINDRGIRVINASAATVKVYVKREQVQGTTYVYGIRLITIGPNSSYLQKASSGTPANITGTVTDSAISATGGSITLASGSDPCTFTFTLAG